MLVIDLFSAFIMAIVDAGLTPPKEVISDGQIHRFSSNGKPGDKSGYYAFFSHPNGFNAGFFGCWRSGLYSTWSSRHESTLKKEEKEFLRQCQVEAQQARENVYKDRSEYANDIWAQAETASIDHAYTQRKQLATLGEIGYLSSLQCSGFFMDDSRTTVLKNVLLIPVHDENNKLQSLQAINAEGKKFFMKGGKMTGGRFTIAGSTDKVYLCEGYATGASLHQLTKATVIIAFNASNLENVAPTLEAAYPDSVIIIAADNDHQKEKEGKGNKGREVAAKLLEQHRMAYTYPPFDDDDNGTDWNDFCCNNSADEALQALADNMVEPPVIFECFDDCIAALEKDQFDENAFDSAINMLKSSSPLQSSSMRKRLKVASGADMGDIRKAISEAVKKDVQPDLTHSQMAEKYLESYGKPHPIGVYGKLWKYNAILGIWEELELSKIGVAVSRKFVSEAICRRGSDYKAIASHVYDTVANEDFFTHVAPGLHTPSGFIYADGKQLRKCDPCAEHRARFCLDIEPTFEQPPTKLLTVLNEAFDGCYPAEQIRQLRMLTGMTLLGLLPKEQRVVLLYGAAGSGKSVYLRLLESIIPSRFRTSISPLDLDSDYKVAALAGKLINLVPEIDKEKPVPSAQFKAITGGDTVSAREPYGKVFSFTPNTACWFNGNYYPTTKDHTEGFWRRWTIINFINTKPAKDRNPKLFNEIIAEELPAILGWALAGAIDYLENGLYLSPAHSACLAEWKRDGNSVTSWLHSADDNNIARREKGTGKQPIRATHAYHLYSEWCRYNHRRAFNSQTFKAHMLSAGYATVVYSGYNCYEALYDARPLPGDVYISDPKW